MLQLHTPKDGIFNYSLTVLLTSRISPASVIKHPRFMEEEFVTIHLQRSRSYLFSTFPSRLSFSSWCISILQYKNKYPHIIWD